MPQEYTCQKCQSSFRRWAGRCPQCGAWNSLAEQGGEGSRRQTVLSLKDLKQHPPQRLACGLAELDRLLGGGFVPGSVLLLAGEPGAGKSTLLLEIARHFSGPCLYVSGEEGLEQIGERARRLELASEHLFFSAAARVEEISREHPVQLLFIDSIQTMATAQHAAGTQSALRQVTQELLALARETRTTVIVTGHITREGSIAGPKLLEHMVDTVLFFESDRLGRLRILRSIKNRFGRTGEIAFFQHTQRGLSVVERPDAELSFQNSILSAMVEGSRALAVEIQALVSEGGSGRRTAEGLDQKRLMLLSAVLDRYLVKGLADRDVFVNLAGGLSSDEPGLDLALMAAVYASAEHRRMQGVFLGEVGLGGEVRPVQQLGPRLEALAGCGAQKIYCAASQVRTARRAGLIGIEHVGELQAIFSEEKEHSVRRSGRSA